MKKKIALTILVLVPALAALTIWQLLTPPDKRLPVIGSITGSLQGGIEQWVGDQLHGVANHYLKPQFSFAKLEYHPPLSVVLTDVDMVVDEVSVISAKVIEVTLAKLPQRGKPIVIERLALNHPVIHIVEREQGPLLGPHDLVETTPGEVHDDGGSTRLSDVFAIRSIDVVNAHVRFEHYNHPAMSIDGLSFEMTSEPGADEPGWYEINTNIAREGLLNADIDGRLNIDDMLFDMSMVHAMAAITPGSYGMFSPHMQTMLSDHELTGRLEIAIDGQLHLSDVLASTLTIDLSVEDVFGRFEDFAVPIQVLDASATLSSGVLTVSPFIVAGLGGTIGVDSSIDLGDEGRATADIDLAGVRIQQLLRSQVGADKKTPKYAGRVDMRMHIDADPDDPLTTANGRGRLEISEGRLVNVPVVRELAKVICGAAKPDGGGNDILTADLELANEAVRVSKLELVSDAVAARGEGKIGFDRSLDLRLNAGPLEKVQNLLGVIGDLFGAITDQLVKYHVQGKVGAPKVSVRPLGIGSEESDK